MLPWNFANIVIHSNGEYAWAENWETGEDIGEAVPTSREGLDLMEHWQSEGFVLCDVDYV